MNVHGRLRSLAATVGVSAVVLAGAATIAPTPALASGTPITGTVVSAVDNTTPIAGICVTAFPHGSPTPDGSAVQTQGDGTYSLPVSSDGLYDVRFDDCTNALYRTQWYQGASSQSAAKAVDTSLAAPINAAMVPAAVPAAPTLGAPVTGYQQITLSWSVPSDGGSPITGYELDRASTSGGALTPVGCADSTATTCTDSGLADATTYYYVVKAINAVGPSSASSEVPASTATVPATPAITATGDNQQVTVTWQPPDDGGDPVTSYTLYRSVTQGALGTSVSAQATSPYVDEQLTNGQTYYYTLTAHNRVGDSAPSVQISATPMTVPAAPSLTATGGPHDVTLNWTVPDSGGSAITGYDVYVASSQDGVATSTPIAQSASTTSYTVPGLDTGATYFFAVSASNHVGEGAQSPVQTASTDPVPGAPQNLAVTQGDGVLSLKWDPPQSDGGSAVLSYNVYRSDVQNQQGSKIGSPSGNGYDDNTVVAGHTYYYEVAAVTAAGEGPASGQYSAVAATTPGAPTSLTATGTAHEIDLTWSAPGATGGISFVYDVYRSSVQGVQGDLWATTTTASFKDTQLANTTTYYYVVTAANAVGESGVSNEATATTASPPSAPTSVAASPGVRAVSLSWTAASPNGSAIQSYNIYRATQAGQETLLATGITGTTYPNSPLDNAATYYYKVSAVNGAGESLLSTETSATTFALPGAPSGVTPVRGNQQVSLSWTAPATGGSPITGYTVYRSTTPAGTPTVLPVTPLATSYVDNGLTNGTTYYYTVTATTAVGTGAASSQVSQTPATTPGAPSITGVTRYNQQVNLSWSVPGDGGSAITGYNVYRSTTAGSQGVQVATGVLGTSFVNTGVNNNTAYYYEISAVNSVSEGTPSAQAPAPVPTAPGAPSILLAAPASNQVTLTWAPPSVDGGSPVTGYDVYRVPTAGGQQFLAASNVAALTYTDLGLTNGTSYDYTVKARNFVGAGAASAPVSVTPADVPSPPQNVAATPGDRQVVVSWSAPTNNGGSAVTGYNVYRATSPTGAATKVSVLPTATSYTDSTVTNGTTYYYDVTATNLAGEGGAVAQVAATPAAKPAAPSVSATGQDSQVTLTWSPPSDGGSPITGYTVYRATTSGGSFDLLAQKLSATSYVDHPLPNGTTYYYKVSASNVMGEGVLSSVASATPATPPSPPQSVTTQRGDRQVTLTWSAPADNGGSPLLSYTVYRAAGQPGAAPTVLSVGPTVTSYTDGVLANGTTYYYEVTASNAAGESGFVAQVSATPATVPGTPATPTTTHSDQTVALNWGAPSSDGGAAVTGYNLYRSTSSGTQGTRIAAGVVGTTYVDTGLTNGTTYFYSVTAVNDVGEGAPTSQAIDRPVGAAPTVAITAAPPSFTASRTASLTFTATDPSQTTLSFTCSLDGSGASSCSSPASFTALTDGTHTLAVNVTDAYGSSSSTTATWVVDTAPPVTSLTKPTTATTLGTAISVAWKGSDASGVQSFDVQYTRATWNGRPSAPISGLANTTATTATLTGIAQGTEYCFQVRARDWAGNLSGWSHSMCTATPLDDRALAASSGWKKLSGRSFYSGTSMQTTSKGRTLTRKGAAGGRALLIVDEGKGFGSVDVLYNGKVVKTLSLAATRTRNQVALTLPKVTKGNTTILIRTRSTRKVLIDGLLLARV